MREALQKDIPYVAECFVNISQHIKSIASDPYINGLPDKVNEVTLDIASSYVGNNNSFTLIAERNGINIGCIAAKIESTSFPPSGIGKIGNIAICWVASEYRKKNIAKELVAKVEEWFSEKDIKIVELSYLAQNAIASDAWEKIGYTPFRVFSHKVLSNT